MGVFRWVFLCVFFCQPCLVQQQVVQRRDRVEEHRLHGRGEQLHQGRNTAGFEDGKQALRWNSWTSRLESLVPCFSQSLLLASVADPDPGLGAF